MSDGHFLHVGFNWVGPPRADELEATMSKAKDWLRYSPSCWILWTSRSPDFWFGQLRPFLGKDDSVLICKLDTSTKQGWLKPWIWEWLNKSR